MIPYHYLKTALKKKGCEPLKKALNEWVHIIAHGKPRDPIAYGDGRNDVLIFTDGWVPDDRIKEKCPPS